MRWQDQRLGLSSELTGYAEDKPILTEHTWGTQILIDLLANETNHGVGGKATTDRANQWPLPQNSTRPMLNEAWEVRRKGPVGQRQACYRLRSGQTSFRENTVQML